MPAKHEAVALAWPSVYCKCGWWTSLLRPDTWGRKRGVDWLLDEYNAHLKKQSKREC